MLRGDCADDYIPLFREKSVQAGKYWGGHTSP